MSKYPKLKPIAIRVPFQFLKNPCNKTLNNLHYDMSKYFVLVGSFKLFFHILDLLNVIHDHSHCFQILGKSMEKEKLKYLELAACNSQDSNPVVSIFMKNTSL